MEKINTQKEFLKDIYVEAIIANFDFAKVAKVMDVLKWTWDGADESPSIGELRSCARDLLYELINNDSKRVSSGGFTVEKLSDDNLKLYFIIEESI